MMFITRIAAVSLTIGTALPLAAQTVLPGDHSVAGSLCVGADCTDSETFSGHELKLKSTSPSLFFEDTTSASRYLWTLMTNTGSNARDFTLMSENAGFTNKPFVVEGLAPDNSLYVDDDGRVGLGTMLPDAELHIKTLNSPVINLEETNFGGQMWRLVGTSSSFQIGDVTNGSTPLLIKDAKTAGVTSNALVIDDEGEVGLGTQFPNQRLHMYRNDGSAMAKIEEASTTTAPRTLLNLQNNGRPEIVMANTGTGGEWSFGAGTNFVLKQGAVASASSAKTKVLTAKPNGDVTIEGTLTTGGSTCGGGCDLVFSDDYNLPGITDHAAQMFSLGHLPNVGPTIENAPINISDKLGRMLNELEHAHIYIAQLEQRTRHLSRLESELAQLKARLAVVEKRE